MNPIYIFRHVATEGPGYLAMFLDKRNVAYRLIAIDQGDVVPGDLSGAGALAFMGGSMSVNDTLPWIEAELRLIRQAYMTRMPVLGHCLGGQLIAKAMGARVRRNAVKEIGWFPVEKLKSATPWFHALPQRFEVFHWHGETFDVPNGATPLLRSDVCEQQAFAMGAILALQFHIEMDAPMVRAWSEAGADELADAAPSVQSAQAMVANLPARITALHKVADDVYGLWLTQVLNYNGVSR